MEEIRDISIGTSLIREIRLVSNRSSFKYPATFLPQGVPTPFLPCTAVTELPTESFQANGARAYRVGNELIDSPLQHDACLITA